MDCARTGRRTLAERVAREAAMPHHRHPRSATYATHSRADPAKTPPVWTLRIGGRRLAGHWSGWARFKGEIEELEEVEEIVCVLMWRSRLKMSGHRQTPRVTMNSSVSLFQFSRLRRWRSAAGEARSGSRTSAWGPRPKPATCASGNPLGRGRGPLRSNGRVRVSSAGSLDPHLPTPSARAPSSPSGRRVF
jgi:hypothetical protein